VPSSDPTTAVLASQTHAVSPEGSQTPEVTLQVDPSGPSLGYMPGLDGIRALALLAVMALHQTFRFAPGGFLGVSTFFTLSGFLIALLAIGEQNRTHHFRLGRFWERRARRLLPAVMVTLLVVVLLQWALKTGSSPAFKGDVLASLGYAANWRFAGTSSGVSLLGPVGHMWSLAIEEQFYLVFPLVFVGVTALVGTGRRAGALFAGLAVASFASAWALTTGDHGRFAYYATFTRAGELLVGVVLAYVLAGTEPGRLAVPRGRWGRAATQVGGVVGLAGLLWLWHQTTLDTPRLFHGITALEAGFSALLILAAVTGGVVAGALSFTPLRLLGRISYGGYLLHWPIFLWLNEARTGIDNQWLLFALRLAVTGVAATLSYFLVEAPIRFRWKVGIPRLAAGLALSGAAVAAIVLAVPVHHV
jgi:peptidoglycan/LPS O-acetylase OafA/YrhL